MKICIKKPALFVCFEELLPLENLFISNNPPYMWIFMAMLYIFEDIQENDESHQCNYGDIYPDTLIEKFSGFYVKVKKL